MKLEFEYMVLSYGEHKSFLKCLWIKTRRIIIKGHLRPDICYQVPIQAEEILLWLLKEV